MTTKRLSPRRSDEPSGLRLRLLGVPQILWQEQPLDAPSKKASALLSYLALYKKPIHKEDLLDVFWPQGQQQNLRLTLRHLRALPGASIWLEGSNPIRLRADTDVNAFKEAVATRAFETAIKLYSGSPQEQLLYGLNLKNIPEFQAFIDDEQDQLYTLLGEALAGRALELEESNANGNALTLWRKLTTLDTLHETAHRGIMRTLYRQGFIQEALAQLETCRRHLKSELGLELSEETRELARAIERSRGHLPLTIKSRERLPKSLLRPPELIGRELEWAKMEEAWRKNQHIFIAGSAGSGKTRLMMDFAKTKGEKIGPSIGKPGDKYVPFSSMVRNVELTANALLPSHLEPWAKKQLARVAPTVFSEATRDSYADEGLSTIYQAWLHFIEAATCYFDVLISEDVHFFDATSMEVASYAFAHLHGSEKLTNQQAKAVVTFRPAEMPSIFAETLEPLAEQGVFTVIELQPLSESHTAQLLRSLELPDSTRLAPHIHKLSGGNPQLILETVKSFHETGSLDRVPEHIELNDGLEAIIQKRLDNLSEDAIRLAQTLAVFQEKVEPELVLEVLELDPFDLTERYLELERAQVISDGFFVHDLIYEVVRRNTPELLTKLLSKRVAKVLEQRGAEPARIAEHWYAAGENQHALPWRYRAAELALKQGLNELATQWLSEIQHQTEDSSLQSKAQKMLNSLSN